MLGFVPSPFRWWQRRTNNASRATRPAQASGCDRLCDSHREDRHGRRGGNNQGAIGQGSIGGSRSGGEEQQANIGGALGYCQEGSSRALALMAISSASASITVCEDRDWTISNLELQKILYLAHMRHLGTRNLPLLRDNFQAWKFGPVISPLYHQVKKFGNKPIRRGFFIAERNLTLPEHAQIHYITNLCRNISPGQLVEMTHEPGGAWDLYFDQDVQNLEIPNNAIRNEYLAKPF